RPQEEAEPPVTSRYAREPAGGPSLLQQTAAARALVGGGVVHHGATLRAFDRGTEQVYRHGSSWAGVGSGTAPMQRLASKRGATQGPFRDYRKSQNPGFASTINSHRPPSPSPRATSIRKMSWSSPTPAPIDGRIVPVGRSPARSIASRPAEPTSVHPAAPKIRPRSHGAWRSRA